MLTLTEKSSSYYALYADLLTTCDRFSARLIERYHEEIACRAGCAKCCILKTVFPVEAYNIKKYISQNGLAVKNQTAVNNDRCLFLKDDLCLIYPVRPVICRTHGSPILIEGKIDYCPENFKGISTIESENILDLDKVNSALAVINRGFTENLETTLQSERISFDEIINRPLFLDTGK